MTERNRQYWQTLSQQLSFNGQAWINGAYVDSLSGNTFDCISPIDGNSLTRVTSCDQQDVDLAVSVARTTFEQGIWSRMAPADRKQILLNLADIIDAHREELALLETLDMGKPIRDSYEEDIPDGSNAIRWCAEALDKIYGDVATTDESALGLITREPVGVVAAIIPWNYPLYIACEKLGPALGVGNSVILKPSEKSPLTAIRIAELAEKAGLPTGALQVIPGYGGTAGKALALHNDVDCLAFTGSSRVAKQLMIYSGESNMKSVWLEAGGKSPNIVFADAENLDEAAKVSAMAIGCNQGEVCTAASRLMVEDSIHDEFIKRVQQHIQDWYPSDPLDPQSTSGAMVDDIQTAKVMNYIEQGQQEGARLILGGSQILKDTGGLYIEPTIFTDVQNTMTIAREEIFGPVLSVIRFNDEQEAIRIANDTHYGLGAAVWTSNLSKAHRVARRLRSGSVFINNYYGGDMTVPFGGYKQSGIGRDKSLYAFDKYVELKTTWISLENI